MPAARGVGENGKVGAAGRTLWKTIEQEKVILGGGAGQRSGHASSSRGDRTEESQELVTQERSLKDKVGAGVDPQAGQGGVHGKAGADPQAGEGRWRG